MSIFFFYKYAIQTNINFIVWAFGCERDETNERMRNKQQQQKTYCIKINCEQDKHSNVFNKCSVIVIKITLEFSTENCSWNENQIEKQNQMKNHG